MVVNSDNSRYPELMATTVRRRLTRIESQEQTRTRLIEAACHQVAMQGLSAASVRDIAEAAGYSLGAFYSNFESKEALMLEVMRHRMALEANRLGSVFDEAGKDGPAAMAGLEHWASAFIPDKERAMLAVELELYAQRNRAFGREYEAVLANEMTNFVGLVTKLLQLHGKKPRIAEQDIAKALVSFTRSLALSFPKDKERAAALFILFIRGLLQAAENVAA